MPPPATKKSASKPSAKPVKAKKNIRKKKVHLKFNVECKTPVEDGILKVEDFVCSFLLLFLFLSLEIFSRERFPPISGDIPQ